jgi:hypothetical protein
MSKIRIILVIIVIGLLATFLLVREVRSARADRRITQECYAAGGQPIYDLCAKHIELIKLPGVPYAPEIDNYH